MSWWCGKILLISAIVITSRSFPLNHVSVRTMMSTFLLNMQSERMADFPFKERAFHSPKEDPTVVDLVDWVGWVYINERFVSFVVVEVDQVERREFWIFNWSEFRSEMWDLMRWVLIFFVRDSPPRQPRWRCNRPSDLRVTQVEYSKGALWIFVSNNGGKFQDQLQAVSKPYSEKVGNFWNNKSWFASWSC